MRVSRNISKERQEQLAREMGISLPKPERDPNKPVQETNANGEFFYVPRHVKPFPEIMKESQRRRLKREAQPKPLRIEPRACPCKEAGLTEGRHKIKGGHCIDGVFWTDVEIRAVRGIKAMGASESMIGALVKLKAELDLDVEPMTITSVVH